MLPSPPNTQPGDAAVLEAVNRQPWAGRVFRSLEPGTVPDGSEARDDLERIGLVDEGGRALLRLNDLRDMPFVTDGAWSLRRGGLFPWSDESEDLLDRIEGSAALHGAAAIVDLATGCGHTAVALAARAGAGRTVFAFDVAPRAERFVDANARLAGASVTFLGNDVRRGLPAIDAPGPRLVVANLPHAICPEGLQLPAAIAGGTMGTNVARCALRSLRRWIGSDGVALFLTYSLADRSLQRYEILEFAEEELGAASVSWRLLGESMLWRVNGTKRHRNPMPLGQLADKASCGLTVEPGAAAAAGKAYDALAQRLEGKGWGFLAYGVLEIVL